MRIFDVYEHPSFEVDKADKASVQSTIRRLSVGATVSALAAISFWGYFWSDLSASKLMLSAPWPTGIRNTYHSVLQKGGL